LDSNVALPTFASKQYSAVGPDPEPISTSLTLMVWPVADVIGSTTGSELDGIDTTAVRSPHRHPGLRVWIGCQGDQRNLTGLPRSPPSAQGQTPSLSNPSPGSR